MAPRCIWSDVQTRQSKIPTNAAHSSEIKLDFAVASLSAHEFAEVILASLDRHLGACRLRFDIQPGSHAVLRALADAVTEIHLKEANINCVASSPSSRIVIVGDIHGRRARSSRPSGSIDSRATKQARSGTYAPFWPRTAFPPHGQSTSSTATSWTAGPPPWSASSSSWPSSSATRVTSTSIAATTRQS